MEIINNKTKNLGQMKFISHYSQSAILQITSVNSGYVWCAY